MDELIRTKQRKEAVENTQPIAIIDKRDYVPELKRYKREIIKLDSIEGYIQDIVALNLGYPYNGMYKEDWRKDCGPHILLRLAGNEQKYFLGLSFRIDIGERIKMYSVSNFKSRGGKHMYCPGVDALQIMDSRGNIKFQYITHPHVEFR